MDSFQFAWNGLEWVVKKDLEKLEFVQWDRYTEAENDLNIYGWIKRGDSYKDFVLLTYQSINDTNQYRLSAYTSSSKYSHKISELLFENTESHVDCKRVENVFGDIKNVIKLGAKDKL